MEHAEPTRGGWPPGAAGGAAFLVGVVVLLLILRFVVGSVPLERDAMDNVLEFEAAVASELGEVVVRPATRLRVRMADIVWLDGADEVWVRSPGATFSLTVDALLGGPVVVEDAVVEAPQLRLVQYGPGQWNYERPLAPIFAPDPPDQAEPVTGFRIRNLLARDGQIAVVMEEATYRVTDLRMVLATAVLSGPGVREPTFHVSRADGAMILPDTADGTFTRPVAMEDGRFRLRGGTLAFDIARMDFGASSLVALVGVWDQALGGLELDARATVERLELADIPWLQVEAPEEAVASGDVAIHSLPGERSAVVLTGMAIRSETSAATGSLHITFGPPGQVALESVDLVLDPLGLSLVEAFTGPLPYVGTLHGTVQGTADDIALDLQARLATSPATATFNVDVTGRLAITDPGVEVRRVTAELRAVPLTALEPLAPGLPLRGLVNGTVELTGTPGQVPIGLDVRLETGSGVVTVAGTVDLRASVPEYDVTGRIVGLELQQVLEPAIPPVQLNTTFALAGRGTSLPEITAAVRMDGRFTGWQDQPGDTVAIRVQLDRGLIMAEDVRIAVGPVDLAASGNWRVANGEGGAIRYVVGVDTFDPLAPYLPPGPAGLPFFTRGSLAAQGTLAGTLDSPALAGTLSVVDFRYGEWAAAQADAEYDVRLGPGLPVGTATATGRDLRTPGVDFDTAELVADFTRPNFAARFRGDRVGDAGLIEFEADGRIDDELGEREVVFRTLELDLEQQRWRLPAPARIDWTTGDVVHVQDLRLEQVDDGGIIRLDGIISPFDLTDLRVEIAALPIGDLVALARADLDIAGNLWLRGTLRGPADLPTLDLDLRLLEGRIAGVSIQELRGEIGYTGRTLTVLGEGLFEETARFEVDGGLPVDLVLGLPPTFELVDDGPIRGRFRTHEFPLSALETAIPTVRDIEGRLTANLSLEGTPVDPTLSGSASMTGGAMTVPLLNQRYERIEGEATLAGQIIQVERLLAWRDGYAALSGNIRVEDLVNPVLDLTLELQGFRPQGVSGRRDAAFTGQIQLAGTPGAPVLSGRLLVDDGTLDIGQFQPAPRFSDDLIGIAERFDPLAPMDFDLLEPTEAPFRISRLDLTAGGDLWFQAEEFRAQLSGDLTVQRPEQEVFILGTLSGQRGTFNLRIGPATRRFDIVDANIQFFGTGELDPALDITAARIIPGPNRTDFELRVRVTGTLTGPAVAFATEDGTSIPEAEALNFLVFGRATATLADFPGAGIGTAQSLYDALAFYGISDRLSEALAEQFGAGIDYFQVQVRSGGADFGPELYFLLGHEIVPGVFALVTVPTAEFTARWSLTGEWRIDRQWMLEAGYEPPDLLIGIPGRRLPFAVERDQQLFISIRRRWAY